MKDPHSCTPTIWTTGLLPHTVTLTVDQMMDLCISSMSMEPSEFVN